jgi:hypothetical protein
MIIQWSCAQKNKRNETVRTSKVPLEANGEHGMTVSKISFKSFGPEEVKMIEQTVEVNLLFRQKNSFRAENGPQ